MFAVSLTVILPQKVRDPSHKSAREVEPELSAIKEYRRDSIK
jgi:hypothetical protein